MKPNEKNTLIQIYLFNFKPSQMIWIEEKTHHELTDEDHINKDYLLKYSSSESKLEVIKEVALNINIKGILLKFHGGIGYLT